MKFTVIIPARYASTRLPGKPLADIAGKPMIQRVYECALKSHASDVIVATDDQRVFDVVKRFDGKVCMTSTEHESGTDRLQEVVQKLGLNADDIVVNVQGDEPLIPAAVINQVAANLNEFAQASAATLSEKIADVASVFDENAVKVVSDVNGYALYFSRASIPWERGNFSSDRASLGTQSIVQRHIGIYAYRVGLLNEFVTWPMAPIENLEKLEQLRILFNGKKIHVQEACEVVPTGVDTPHDLENMNRLFSKEMSNG